MPTTSKPFFLIIVAGFLALVLACGGAQAATAISACRTPIATPGSYVLTANLTNPDNTAPCLLVKVPYVTIDLAGYLITGAGASFGIQGNDYLRVINGAIRSFQVGVASGAYKGVALENLRIVGSAQNGANLGDNARVTGSEFFASKGYGLAVQFNAVVTNSTFASNGISGVSSQNGATLSGNTASANGSHGFAAGLATLIGNVARNNGGYGFAAGAGSVLKANAATGNKSGGYNVTQSVLVANSAYGNPGWGYLDGKWSTFQNNVANFNGADGFVTNGQSTFTANTSSNNNRGFNVTCPTNLQGNTSQTNTTNFVSSGVGCLIVNNLGF